MVTKHLYTIEICASWRYLYIFIHTV